jgi:hypothetical protein
VVSRRDMPNNRPTAVCAGYQHHIKIGRRPTRHRWRNASIYDAHTLMFFIKRESVSNTGIVLDLL